MTGKRVLRMTAVRRAKEQPIQTAVESGVLRGRPLRKRGKWVINMLKHCGGGKTYGEDLTEQMDLLRKYLRLVQRKWDFKNY